MKVLYNWLKEYVDIKDSPEDLIEVFTRLGMEVEDTRKLKEEFSGLKTAVIEDIEPHPSKEGYYVVNLKLKDRTLVCVSGSKGLEKGKYVFVATEGTILKKGTVQEKEVSGVISGGNIVSLEDIGIEEDSDTVFFPEDVTLDTSPMEYLGLDDFLYDLYITPNRPDLLGYLGIAVDLAAFYNEKVHIPQYGVEEDKTLEVVPFEIEDADGCPRYTGRVIVDVNIKDSPIWLKRKLAFSDIRPISNVVDITNYVLLELGHPLHAFDLDKISKKIFIRRAKNESIFALDGKEYRLDGENLVIADMRGPVAIAGIIGGEETSVNQSTSRIFLESAYFEPARVAKGVFRFGVRTESAIRFMKGADLCMPPVASNRAAHLIKQLAGGRVSQIVDKKMCAVGEKKIKVRVEKISKLLGEEVREDALSDLFNRLGFSYESSDRGVYNVHIPSRRRDMDGEPDIAEEYLRLFGFDRIGLKLSMTDNHPGDLPLDVPFYLRNTMFSQGLWEIKTVEFVSLNEHEWFSDTKPIEIQNPISAEYSIMRSSLLPGLLRSGALNIRYGNDGVKLFEIGRVFINEKQSDWPYYEPLHLGAFVGGFSPRNWYEKKRQYDFYDVKGILDGISHAFGIEFTLKELPSVLPGFSFSADVYTDRRKIGVIGEVSQDVLKFLDVRVPLFVFELDITGLNMPYRKFKEFSRFPIVERDISLLVPKNTGFSNIKDTINNLKIPNLEYVSLVDIFTDKKMLGDRISMTISLKFLSKEGTLESKVVDGHMEKILKALENKGYAQRT